MDLDGSAPDDPSHHVIEPGLAGVVVGDVLQVAHERVEAQPATGRRATEPDPAPATVDATHRGHGHEVHDGRNYPAIRSVSDNRLTPAGLA